MNTIKKKMIISIKRWIYCLHVINQLDVFIGKEVYWDDKQKRFFETGMEYKFVASAIPELKNAHLGDVYEVIVEEEPDSQYGYQWQIKSTNCVESAMIRVIRDFLTQIKVTSKSRDTLIKAYGKKTLNTILDDASALDVIKVQPDSKQRIRCAMEENRSFIELLAFLEKREWDCRWALPLHKRYGDVAIATLRVNPYILYEHELYKRELYENEFYRYDRHGDELDKCRLTDFRTADRVFLSDRSSGPANAHIRCWQAVMAALYEEAEQNGGTFIPRKELLEKIAPLLWDTTPDAASNCTISENDISKALDWLEEVKWIHRDHVSGREDIYLSQLYYAETGVVEGLQGLCLAKKPVAFHEHEIDSILAEYEAASRVQLTPTQRMAVKQMLTDPVCVITGGPGTGKTLLVKAAIYVLRKLQSHAVVWCCAPTGKAADLMPAEACTIDRLIESEKWKNFNQAKKRDPDIIFVDEVSMVGIELFSALLAVIPAGARLVLIGDQNQLPSIKAGQLLRDLIDSGVIRSVHLHEVFRQESSSGIPSFAKEIIDIAPDQDMHLEETGAGFEFNQQISDPHRIVESVVRTYKRLLKKGMSFSEIQVILRQRDGIQGTRNMNRLLQDRLNPQPIENKVFFNGKEFRLHDRVIHTKNNYDKNVFNGEIGEIIEVQHTRERMLTVKYPSKTVSYSKKDLEELDLAYALTVHKCQGSEFSVVIIPIAGKGISCRLLYTAVTRGRKLVLLIGTESALTAEMRGESTDDRASHLALRLRRMLPPILPEAVQTSLFPPTQESTKFSS